MLSHFLAKFSGLVSQLAWPDLASRDMATVVIFAAFALLFVLELFFGNRPFAKRILRNSYLTNLGLLLLNDTAMALLSIGALCLLASNYSEFGLLSFLGDPWLKAFLSFLILDLTLYAWHVACHRYIGLWRFHRVHHSDVSMNVSTAFRVHIMELLLTTLIKAMVILAMGIETAVVLVSETVTTLFVMLHHTNIAFAGESLLSRLFIVPRLHRTHHSQLRAEHDHNYGAVLSLWDRMFGTLSEVEPVAIGLKNVPEHSLWESVKYGFASLNPPVLAPSKNPVPNALPAGVDRMIAEAAYYRAERRGFMPGHEVSDWIQAEREILFRLGLKNRRQPQMARCRSIR
jgi:sterol desaturase/sphingolipid hydroxylase (fatty acid hydroxylase superfamily)